MFALKIISILLLYDVDHWLKCSEKPSENLLTRGNRCFSEGETAFSCFFRRFSFGKPPRTRIRSRTFYVGISTPVRHPSFPPVFPKIIFGKSKVHREIFRVYGASARASRTTAFPDQSNEDIEAMKGAERPETRSTCPIDHIRDRRR